MPWKYAQMLTTEILKSANGKVHCNKSRYRALAGWHRVRLQNRWSWVLIPPGSKSFRTLSSIGLGQFYISEYHPTLYVYIAVLFVTN
jgi:hypothetical protein